MYELHQNTDMLRDLLFQSRTLYRSMKGKVVVRFGRGMDEFEREWNQERLDEINEMYVGIRTLLKTAKVALDKLEATYDRVTERQKEADEAVYEVAASVHRVIQDAVENFIPKKELKIIESVQFREFEEVMREIYSISSFVDLSTVRSNGRQAVWWYR